MSILADDHPLWCVNQQIIGLLNGEGAAEDHEGVIKFLMDTGLPEATARCVHVAVCCAKAKSDEIETLRRYIESLPEQGEAVAVVERDKEWEEDCWYYNGKNTLRLLVDVSTIPLGTNLYTTPQPAPEDRRELPEKATPAIIQALRTGSRKDYPSAELCNVRWAAIRAAITSTKVDGK